MIKWQYRYYLENNTLDISNFLFYFSEFRKIEMQHKYFLFSS